MSISPGPVFNPVNLSPVPPPQTPPPSPQSPSDRVIRTVEFSGSTFVVRGGSPEVCPKVKARQFQVLTLADAQGEISVRFSPGSGVKVRVDRAVILGRRPSPGMSSHPFEDGDIDPPVRHLHRRDSDGSGSKDDRTGSPHNV
jgi:hypothetical protein